MLDLVRDQPVLVILGDPGSGKAWIADDRSLLSKLLRRKKKAVAEQPGDSEDTSEEQKSYENVREFPKAAE